MALSVGLPRPGVTRHRCLLESGLSSRPCGPAAIRPSAQAWPYACTRAASIPIRTLNSCLDSGDNIVRCARGQEYSLAGAKAVAVTTAASDHLNGPKTMVQQTFLESGRKAGYALVLTPS